MRSIFALLAGVVAVLAFAAALPMGWVATHAADEDGYVGFTTSLIDDPQFRAEIVGAVADDVVDRTGVSGAFAAPVRSAVEAAATAVADTDQFRTAFEQTQRESHRAVFDGAGTSDRFVLDLAPVAAAIIDAVTGNLPVTLESPDQLLVSIGDQEQAATIDAIKQAPSRAILLVGAAVVAAGLSLLAARRRSSAVMWLGLGAALAAAAVRVGAQEIVPRVIDRTVPPSRLAARAQDLLAGAALDSFDHWVLVTLIAGGVAAVVGLLARAAGGAR